MKSKPITAVIVGAGQRAMIYASYAIKHPERLRIVAIVEPNEARRELAAKAHDVGPEHCFSSVEEMVAGPKLADAVINGTMDLLHVQTTVPLLEAGYDVLLEKPIGIDMDEIWKLRQAAERCGRLVMICHVLRYAPFYMTIRRMIQAGDIGDILNVQTAEHVRYDHMAVSFVRGKWNSEKACGSSMLLQKCCHDLDILAWMMGGVKPTSVSSYGGRMFFRPEKAPEGAGKRCLVDCKMEDSCVYSARKHYLERALWGQYVWDNAHLGQKISAEEKLKQLRDESPYGRCVWHSDNDVVDHQSVIVEFENGATASHNMVGGAAKASRTLHIIGTKGEIQGTMDDGCFVLRKPDIAHAGRYTEQMIALDVKGDSHGGGDLRLVEDFVDVLLGAEPSISYTSLDQSIYGHAIGFAAEAARRSGTVIQHFVS
ncbi:Gfo/Idh/MocA family protein [Marinicrinis lubricantis]|uniref:Gfo/Idh/MocA family protein n=1 Tax=Marinicrinis lubricantis TaxID=2086470 RepID=A0ABW1ILD5_9BACL